MPTASSPRIHHVGVKSSWPAAETVVAMTHTTPRLLALRDAGSVALGLLSFGITLGVTISVLGFGALPGLIGAVTVYGGSAQLTAITLVHQGTALLLVVASAAVVNTRLLLYGAALAWRFREQPSWFSWLAPHFVIDQTYLLADARPDLDQRAFRRYWGWLGGSIALVWSASIAIGIATGPILPTMPHLGLVGTALFLGMLAPRLTNRPAVAAALAGGLSAAVASLVRPELGIVCGAVVGVAVGTAVQR